MYVKPGLVEKVNKICSEAQDLEYPVIRAGYIYIYVCRHTGPIQISRRKANTVTKIICRTRSRASCY